MNDDSVVDPKRFEIEFPVWVITEMQRNLELGLLHSVVRAPFQDHGKCVLLFTDEAGAMEAVENLDVKRFTSTPVANNMMLATLLWHYEQEGLTDIVIDPYLKKMTGRFVKIKSMIEACRDGEA